MSRRTAKAEDLFPRVASLACAYCGNTRPPRRARWCGPTCAHAVAVLCSYNLQLAEVEERDRGICKRCGIDTKRLRSVLWHCGRQVKQAVLLDLGFKSGRQGRRLWHADHVVPLVFGGGAQPGMRVEALLANLQTLCTRCHEDKTRADTEAIRAARADGRLPPVQRRARIARKAATA